MMNATLPLLSLNDWHPPMIWKCPILMPGMKLFLDGTDWLLGRDSLPESAANAVVNYKNDDSGILLDDYELKRAMKISSLRIRMAADSMNQNQNDNVEAATIRGMIQKAV
jgi:hypothetical protein